MYLEDLAEIVSQRLWLLQLDQLKEVCLEAKIPNGDVMTRRALIRQITESMENAINDVGCFTVLSQENAEIC